MSLFDKVSAWIAPKSPASEGEEKLRQLLDAATKIVSAYGATLESCIESNKGSMITKYSETDLPYTKQIIRKSIGILQQALRDPTQRTILIQIMSPIEAQQVLSPQFEASIGAGLIFLDSFVSTAEVEAERKELDKVYKTIEQVDPTWRERKERDLQRARTPEGRTAMKQEPEMQRLNKAIEQLTQKLTPEDRLLLNNYDLNDPKTIALKERMEKEIGQMFKSGEMDRILSGKSEHH
jgi:hypothetical protein